MLRPNKNIVSIRNADSCATPISKARIEADPNSAIATLINVNFLNIGYYT